MAVWPLNVQFPFCSFCAEHSLPVAYFLRLAPSCVPLTEHYKVKDVKPERLFVPCRFHQTPIQGERQCPLGSQGSAGGISAGIS